MRPSALTLKTELRALALARRDGVAEPARVAASLAAAEHAKPILTALRGKIMSGYWPIRSEADPRPLLAIASQRGAALALPVTAPDGLLFRTWRHGDALQPAGFGTMGPMPAAPAVTPDIMIMPLAAFDRRLHRIGYGQGHYDRAIDAMRRRGALPVLVGLAFAVQEVEKVPFEPHDIPLDFIVTEEGLIAADRA